MTGERRPYSASDLSSWQNTARLYFSNGFAGMYYVSPQNEPEQNYNAGVIADLKAHQESVIKAFLEDNKGTLAKISSELFDKPVLTAESLSGFLMDVRIHEGLPRLSNKTFEEAFSPKKTIINYLIDTPD